MKEVFTIASKESEQCFDITDQVKSTVARSGGTDGGCHVMALHSTAAVGVNETHDPNIGRDVITALGRMVPTRAGWLHDEIDDNAHSHVKASLLGPSEVIAVEGGELVLGTWQGIWFIDFDGPRDRTVSVRVQ